MKKGLIIFLLLVNIDSSGQEIELDKICLFEGQRVKHLVTYLKQENHSFSIGSRPVGFHMEFAQSLVFYTAEWTLSIEFDGIVYRGVGGNRHHKAAWKARNRKIKSLDFHYNSNDSSIYL